MSVHSRSFSLVLALGLAACASSGGQGQPPTQGAAPAPVAPPTAAGTSVQAGGSTPAVASGPTSGATFSAAQADRGRDKFRSACTECHYSSEFSDAQFKFKWSRRTAGALYEFIATSMPESAPGSLSGKESVDLVTYLLRMNGFPPGTGELAADRAILDAISLQSIRD